MITETNFVANLLVHILYKLTESETSFSIALIVQVMGSWVMICMRHTLSIPLTLYYLPHKLIQTVSLYVVQVSLNVQSIHYKMYNMELSF